MNANEALKSKELAEDGHNAMSKEQDQFCNPDSSGSTMISEALILYVETLFMENRLS